MAEKIDVSVSGIPEKVSILIPTYNILYAAKRCIESILTNTSYPIFEICVSDDASPNIDLISYLKNIQSDKVKIEFGTSRLQYGANTMRAFNLSDGQFICLLNDDSYIPAENKDWLQKLVDQLKNNPTYGSVTPKILYGNNTVYWVGKRMENFNNPSHDFLHRSHNDPAIPKEPINCFYNNFSCCLTWRELINRVKIGEIHNHYGSDSAWCCLTRDKFNLQHYMVPVTYVFHDNLYGQRG